ncbi:hypothetical protein C4D60_Mb08t28320 [Musa balbisiana]|uniref:X8 domain-containing protein n=1 Tax=Musa balbisiana TaxID=52838 RepID=A0A4V4H998_MUSBA|nr:hypothetical protein C4D60_Mb08t28320 [Musa balbisiana]
MAVSIFLLLILAMSGVSDAAWCVCRSDMSTTTLQKTLDYACGAGADCTPILQNGACYNPNTVLAHCSYAANSYYQGNGQTQDACNFAGTAILTSTDPGNHSSPNASNVLGHGQEEMVAPILQVPASSTSTSTTPSSTTTTGTTGTGGVLGGLGPTGTNSFDGSDGCLIPIQGIAALFLTILLSSLAIKMETTHNFLSWIDVHGEQKC